MRLTERDARLLVHDTPGCFWLFGLWFVAGGALAIIMVFAAENRADVPLWGRAAALAIGLATLAAGLFVIRSHPATHTTLDYASGRGCTVVRRPGGGRETIEFALAEVRALEVREERDDDGDPMYSMRLWLAGSRVVPLHGQPLRGADHIARHAAHVRRFLGLPDGPGAPRPEPDPRRRP